MTGIEIATGIKLADAISAISVMTGTAGALSSAASQKAAADFNVRMMERQAERERQIAEADAADYRRKQMKLLSSSRALRAASGVAMTGTSLLIDDAMLEDIEFNAETIRRGGQAKGGNLIAQAQRSRMRGRAAMTQGYFSAAGNTLGHFASK